MSGVLGALAAAGNASRYSVGVGQLSPGGTAWGYNPAGTPSPGTISATAFKTATINNVATQAGIDFGIVMDGTQLQTLFDSIVVEGNSGTRFFHASAASFLVFGGGTLTSWQWGSGGSPVWTSAATRILLLRY